MHAFKWLTTCRANSLVGAIIKDDNCRLKSVFLSSRCLWEFERMKFRIGRPYANVFPEPCTKMNTPLEEVIFTTHSLSHADDVLS